MSNSGSFRIRIGGATNVGWGEIATADDSTDAIYVRQYSGNFATLTRTLTLLDAIGNTTIPGNVLINTTDNGIDKLQVNGSSNLNGNTTITGSLNVSGSVLKNGGALALEDGTILYHSLRWFTPTSTISTNGTTVTSIGSQFTSEMVGAKLTINGESRIITAFTNTTNVIVNSAYNVNYSGVVADSWGVYSKSFENIASDSSRNNFYGLRGTRTIYTDTNDNYSVTSLYAVFNNLEGSSFAAKGGQVSVTSVGQFNFNSTNSYLSVKDLGLRRNAAGVLEIYDGVTANGLETNRRDILARNLFGSTVILGTTVNNGIDKLQVTGSTNLNGNTTINGILNVTPSITASLAIARGANLTPTLSASANNDLLVGLDISPTFSNGGFTGVQNIALRLGQNSSNYTRFSIDTNGGLTIRGVSSNSADMRLEPTGFLNVAGAGAIIGTLFAPNIRSLSEDITLSPSGTTGFRLFSSTRNLVLQNGGTFVDGGYRLDVNGTFRAQGTSFLNKILLGTTVDNGIDALQVNGSATINGILNVTPSITASLSIARGANLTPALSASANNDVLVGLDINTTFNNGSFSGVITAAARIKGNLQFSPVSGATAQDWKIYADIEDNNVSRTALYIAGAFGGGARVYIGSSSAQVQALNLRYCSNIENAPSYTVGAFSIGSQGSHSILRTGGTNVVYSATGPAANHIWNGGPNYGGFNEYMRLTTIGNLLIGTATDNGIDKLQVQGSATINGILNVTPSITASLSIARGANLTPTLSASANNDVLVGLEVNPTFNSGSFTNVKNYTIRLLGTGTSNVQTSGINILVNDVGIFAGDNGNTYVSGRGTTSPINFLLGGTLMGKFNATSGNLTLQNGGTFIDDSINRLQVTGSMITSGNINASTGIARGSSHVNTLTATANNDVLVGLDVNPTFNNGSFSGVSNIGLRVLSGFVQIGTLPSGPSAPLHVSGTIRIADPNSASNGSEIKQNGSTLEIRAGSSGGGNIKLINGGNPYSSDQFSSTMVLNMFGGNNYSGWVYSGSRPILHQHGNGIGLSGASNVPGIFVSPSNNVLIGGTTDNGIDKLQINGSASFTSNITANGNVGIGTGSSVITAKLHVNGRLLIVSDGETATFGNLNYTTKYLQVRDGGNYAVRWGLQANNNITLSGTALMMSSKTISFKANAGGTTFENVVDPDFIINTDGVGIGTTNALTRGGMAKLSVVITSSEPIVYGRSNTDAIFLRRISTGSYQFQTTANGGDTGNLFLQPYGGNILIGTTVDNGVDILQVNGSASFSSSIKVGDNTAAASSANAGSIRYRETANGSFSEMSMRTGTSTYAWVIQISNNF
jgi:hypothetical protein